MFRTTHKKGYRSYHPVTSPLVIIGGGLIAFCLAYGIAYLCIRHGGRIRISYE